MRLLDRLSRRFPATLMARRNLSRNSLRSALAVLGIVIGVLAIASLGMFGATLQSGATASLGEIGSEVIVSPAFSEGVQELSDRDVVNIERAAGDASVVPVKSRQSVLERGGERSVVTVYGMETPGLLYGASGGRVPDQLREGAVVGSGVADRFGVRAGNSITLDGETYRVKAVLARQDGFSPVNPNNAVIVPPTDFEEDGFSQVVVDAESGEEANATAVAVRESLNRREQRVTVFELASITDSVNQFFGILNAFLIGVGSISLVVAGVSILNVMLMSTIERREEIGVLRAVGVRKLDVVKVILVEAGLLGLAGGAVGAVLSVGAGMVLNEVVLNDPLATFTATNALYVLLAMSFGLVTSVLSGLYPAWTAANERPVDALRK